MSTRCNIAYENEKDEVIVSYCHSDGYVAYNGVMLHNFYNSYDAAKNLVSSGYISHLTEIFADICRVNIQPSETFKNEYCYMASMQGDIMIEYIYLFRHGQWYVSEQKFIDKIKDGYFSYNSYYSGFKLLETYDEIVQKK